MLYIAKFALLKLSTLNIRLRLIAM